MIMLILTEFCVNWTINRRDRYSQNEFQFGGRPPFWICKFWYFFTWLFLERESASAHQILFKVDGFQLRYGDKTVFKMAAVRHREFSKFGGILVMWPCLNVIILPHTKYRINRTINRWDIAKNDFQYGDRLPFWICKILILCHVTVLRTRICVCVPNFIENRWFSAEI